MTNLHPLSAWYRHVYAVDFEFTAPPGERPHPLCLVARDLLTGRSLRQWLGDEPPGPCPLPTGEDTLYIGYYVSAELQCHLALGWPFPSRVLDLYAEFRWLTSGLPVTAGYGLLGALAHCGLTGIDAGEKTAMRFLAMRGGPYTAEERASLLEYCQTDVDALAVLLPEMLPHLNIPQALFRGRYMAALAHVEWQGIPLDTTLLARLHAHWTTVRWRLAQAVNQRHPVFVPHGQRVLDTRRAVDAAILEMAEAWEVDPYALAGVVDRLWRDEDLMYQETRRARQEARRRSGLTARDVARWERAGYDYSSWPGLDVRAWDVANQLPAAFASGDRAVLDDQDPDYAASLWDLVRHPDPPRPRKDDRRLLRQAVELLRHGADATWDGRPLTFSAARFAQYLVEHDLTWPRLASGDLALDDDTFRTMAKVYPEHIGPVREARDLLAQLRQPALTVGADGYNRTLLGAFGSRTGRNQPRASQYIFGPSCWLRSLIKPGPGRALAYLDWSQQELAISAALSGDTAMQEAYRSGDFYLQFAVMAGRAPAHATKATHGVVRNQFKAVSLGVLYGMSVEGLAHQLDVPRCESRTLLHAHHEVFAQFWAWSDAIEVQAMYDGWLHTPFGWQVQTSPTTSGRSARNFPCQGAGADMLRIATCLAVERGITVCGLVHDALVIEAAQGDIDAAVTATQAVMQEASTWVLPAFPLRTDATIVRYPDRYSDARGAEVWDVIERLLLEDEPTCALWETDTEEDMPF